MPAMYISARLFAARYTCAIKKCINDTCKGLADNNLFIHSRNVCFAAHCPKTFLFADAKDADAHRGIRSYSGCCSKLNGIFWGRRSLLAACHSNYRLSTAACFESKTAAKSKNIRHLLPVVHKIYLTPKPITHLCIRQRL